MISALERSMTGALSVSCAPSTAALVARLAIASKRAGTRDGSGGVQATGQEHHGAAHRYFSSSIARLRAASASRRDSISRSLPGIEAPTEICGLEGSCLPERSRSAIDCRAASNAVVNEWVLRNSSSNNALPKYVKSDSEPQPKDWLFASAAVMMSVVSLLSGSTKPPA